MLFVVAKPEFEQAVRFARDDRQKRTQGNRGPFIRLEADEEHVEVEGLEATAQIPATVYEPGVLFLRVTLFRRLLRSIRGEPFLTIQATADELVFDKVHMPFEANAMLLYPDAKSAPRYHPDQGPLIRPVLFDRPPATSMQSDTAERKSVVRQRRLWAQW